MDRGSGSRARMGRRVVAMGLRHIDFSITQLHSVGFVVCGLGFGVCGLGSGMLGFGLRVQG